MHKSTAEMPTNGYRHRLTRLGIHFLFVATFAMVGGSIRGFNLLLVLAGFLVGALLVQWRTSRRAVESLAVSRELPSEAFAETPFKIRYHVSNHSRWLSVWMIRVDDQIRLADTSIARRLSCALGAISPSQRQSTHCRCLVPQRGIYRLGQVSLTTSFPFALIASTALQQPGPSKQPRPSKQNGATQQLCVYPRLLSLTAGWKRQLCNHRGGMATTINRGGGHGDEFFGLREWQSGDSPRQIHWRTSARLGNLAVRQFEKVQRFDLCILVDAYHETANQSTAAPNTAAPNTAAPNTAAPNTAASSKASNESQSDVEMAISLAATLFTELTKNHSNRILVATAGTKSHAAKHNNADEQNIASASNGSGSKTPAFSTSRKRQRVLYQLAQLRPCDLPDFAGAIQKAAETSGKIQNLVVISPRSFATATSNQSDQPHNQSLRDLLKPWSRKSSFRWIDVSQPATRRWIGEPVASESTEITIAAQNQPPASDRVAEATS